MIDVAAETWKTDRSLLSAADGAIVHRETKQSLPFGKLTQGRKLTKTVSDNVATSPPERWIVAGHSAPKVDGRAFVTGSHEYASDIRLPGMWFGKVLRPTSIGATLASVDTSAASAMPDVVVVRDGDFVGVAAATEGAAASALAAIKAEWKPGPTVSGKDLFTELKSGAGQAAPGRGGGGGAERTGSIEKGLGAADVRLEQTYTIAYIAHAPLEPRAAVARWDDGKLTVWTGTQRPFGVRGELHECIPASPRVRFA